MKPLRLLVSLPNRNHYQQEQAEVAISRASQLGAEARVLDADNNPVVPVTGLDGLPDEGQVWVNRGELTATVVALTTTAVAVEMVVKALQTGVQPPPLTLVELKLYPPLEKLAVKAKKM